MNETFWVAAGVILTVVTVVGGVIWNAGIIREVVDALKLGHKDHETRIRASELTLADHAARLTAAEQWNVGFESAARVGNKSRVPLPKKRPAGMPRAEGEI